MDSVFCCASVQPYRPQILSHEAKFTAFIKQASSSSTPAVTRLENALGDSTPYVVQVVRQVNFGPIECKKHFARITASDNFVEVSEDELISANFSKLNSYKNFKCTRHNKFFELNLYEKDPVNTHHWRANIARPARDIDLPAKATSVAETGTSTADPIIDALAQEASNLKLEDAVSAKEALEVKYTGEASAPPPSPPHTEAQSAIVSGLTKMIAGGGNRGRINDSDDEEESGEYEWKFGPSYYSGGYNDYDDDEGGKDYTACSADDCGYCGKCSY